MKVAYPETMNYSPAAVFFYTAVECSILKADLVKMWETKNKANQIFNPSRKDDPVNNTQQPDANGDTYGTPRNKLYMVLDPSDNKYKVTVDIDVQPPSLRTKCVVAAFSGICKLAGTDVMLPASGPVNLEFLHLPTNPTGADIADFTIRAGIDLNGNQQFDFLEEELCPLKVKDSSGNDLGVPTIRGTDATAYQSAANEIDWIITSPLTAIPLKHARQFLRIFRDGNFANVPQDLQPSVYAYDNNFNCFSGLFSEWLTHNSGAGFNDTGDAGIWHYSWNETKSVSALIGNSAPIVGAMNNFYWTSVYPQVVTDFQGKPVGYRKTYPSATTSYDVPHDSESPSWVQGGMTVTFANFPELLANGDDLNGTIGRGRLISHKVQFTVEKKETDQIVLDVVDVRAVGEVQDLYDFNHEAGGAAQNAAILQIGHGNGNYGSTRNQGVIWRNTINFDISYDHLPE